MNTKHQTLLDIIQRQSNPEPWAEGEKIPWNDPEFSHRMLQEHLSQDHDAASRRFSVIDKHVAWIHHHLAQLPSSSTPRRILDIGCGPGLYTSRLARLGYECVGIDFSPASIAYAKASAEQDNLPCVYHLDDLRNAEFGNHYDLVMSIFGEFNVFRPGEAHQILHKAWAALNPGGLLLLEVHTLEFVKRLGEQPPGWYSTPQGLFSEQPHICLQESFWNASRQVTTERYYVINAQTGKVNSHASSMQAYSQPEYTNLLAEHHFGNIRFLASLEDSGEKPAQPDAELIVILAYRAVKE